MVFISYKSEEYDIAKRIRALLVQNNYPCWMAPESIPAGSNYMMEIPQAIRTCDLFVLIISEASQQSQWVQKEIDRAVKFNKYILPFHVDDSELIDAIDFVVSNNQRIQAYQNFEPACQELLRAVKQLHPPVKEPDGAASASVKTGKQEDQKKGASLVEPLLKRVSMFLEDEDWNSANAYCEKVLDLDPENAQAYIGKLLVDLRLRRDEQLGECDEPFDRNRFYIKAIRFADPATKKQLTEYINRINTRNENARLEKVYSQAKVAFQRADAESEYLDVARKFESISAYKDAAAMARQCHVKIEELRKAVERKYSEAKATYEKADTEAEYLQAARVFESISHYKDSAALARKCHVGVESLRQAQLESKYEEARAVFNKADSETDCLNAAHMFEAIQGYKDSVVLAQQSYNKAEVMRKEQEERRKKLDRIYYDGLSVMRTAKTEQDYWHAARILREIKNYKDAEDLRNQCVRFAESIKKDKVLHEAKEKMALDSFTSYCEAIDLCSTISGWKDADQCAEQCRILINNILEQRERKAKRRKRALVITLLLLIAIAIALAVGYYYFY